MFRNHKDFENFFKSQIDPNEFPVNIMWDFICIRGSYPPGKYSVDPSLGGNPAEEKAAEAFFEWLDERHFNVNELSSSSSCGKEGNYGHVVIDENRGIARKFYLDEKVDGRDPIISPIENSLVLIYCLEEMINYFVFKIFLGPEFFNELHGIYFRNTGSDYQLALDFSILKEWNHCDDANNLRRYFNNIENLWNYGITLVHGDLKRDNIMTDCITGNLVLIDFSISLYHIQFEEQGESPLFNYGFDGFVTAPNAKHVDLAMLGISVGKRRNFEYDELYANSPPEPYSWLEYKNMYLENSILENIL